MIFEALELIRTELAAYLAPRNATAVDVALGSIASAAGTQTDQVLISLVNVEEETALKNSSPYQRNATGGFDVVNPPVFLNLFVLIAANFNDNATYATALKRLAWVVQCFQQKSEFTVANTPSATIADAAVAVRLHVALDLYSLSFEKLNQLWGTLGGKQVPCVLYKARVVEEQADGLLNTGPEIMRVEGRTGTLELQLS
ncbi:DUF4255 domain-containing protein [Hymenobacter terricola]|uniref:DUF4255 domain-containing protein n=1 Tax=Hymenobacter terricola TaxID=2819236 RepID=UPI001B302B1D|nr:DUF4255 domain-containing protein [Hymenobacter terricola]